MSLASNFNRTLNRESKRETRSSNLNDHRFLDQTAKSPQSLEFFNQEPNTLDSGLKNLSISDQPKTPVSATTEQFGQQSTDYLSPTSHTHYTEGSAKRQSKNFSMPTSFLRHRSDSRVSYIDSSVNTTPFYSPNHSNGSSARNSTEGNSYTDPADKRRSFNVLAHKGNLQPEKVINIPDNAPRELVPILTLFNSQQARVYKEGYFQLVIEKIPHGGGPGKSSEVMSCFGTLSGIELAIWNINQSDFKPIYINVTDASFTNMFDQNAIKIVNPSLNKYYLRFESSEVQRNWFSALILCYFEFNCLHEAYTGALLSAKATKLNDIKTLLSETRYSFGEWCNIKLNYISSKWIKVYIVVIPSVKEKPGCVNFYTNDKNQTKKNLILTITQGFSCYSVYPLVPEAVDNSSLVKLEGAVTIHNWKYLLSKGASNNTTIIPPSPSFISQQSGQSSKESSKSRSRSSSLGSLMKRRSTTSLNSSGSETNIGAHNPNEFVSSIYIMPEQHPGVPNFEIMIRLLIPLFDAFELYGRPKRLISDKNNINSLLFALPVLPKSKYLDLDDVFELILAKIAGIPIPREPSKKQIKPVIKVTTTNKKGVVKKKSKNLLSVFKKSKQSDTVDYFATNTDEYQCNVPTGQWTNREWLFFLKHELKYKLTQGYDGAGHLVEDFGALL